MTYQTNIPDDFQAPQYLDERWVEADAALGNYRAGGPWIVALARPELDPSSRVHFRLHDADYKIGEKKDRVAMMQAVRVGAGRVRCGHREVPQVAPGDMVLVNLREAGHWIVLRGTAFYLFTNDVAMARVYRTDKPVEPPLPSGDPVLDRQARGQWQDALFWNIRDVLNDYVVLARDPNAEKLMRSGDGHRIITPDTVLSDGARSDNLRDNRFPVVYRRVLGAGPGRSYRREEDGVADWVHSAPEVSPGDMMALSKNVRSADFTFQGMPLEIIHANSVLVYEDGDLVAAVDESLPTPIKFDVPAPDEDEEPAPPTLITGKG